MSKSSCYKSVCLENGNSHVNDKNGDISRTKQAMKMGFFALGWRFCLLFNFVTEMIIVVISFKLVEVLTALVHTLKSAEATPIVCSPTFSP